MLRKRLRRRPETWNDAAPAMPRAKEAFQSGPTVVADHPLLHRGRRRMMATPHASLHTLTFARGGPVGECSLEAPGAYRSWEIVNRAIGAGRCRSRPAR